jgi:hypothetical protein
VDALVAGTCLWLAGAQRLLAKLADAIEEAMREAAGLGTTVVLAARLLEPRAGLPRDTVIELLVTERGVEDASTSTAASTPMRRLIEALADAHVEAAYAPAERLAAIGGACAALA